MTRKIALAVITALLGLSLTACTDEFKETCEGQGGVVKRDSKPVTSVGIDSKGKSVVITTVITTRFCVVNGEIVATP